MSNVGYEVTVGYEIIRALRGRGPMDDAQLYDRVQRQSPEFDLATFYRLLPELTALGVVKKAEVDGITVYELS